MILSYTLNYILFFFSTSELNTTQPLIEQVLQESPQAKGWPWKGKTKSLSTYGYLKSTESDPGHTVYAISNCHLTTLSKSQACLTLKNTRHCYNAVTVYYTCIPYLIFTLWICVLEYISLFTFHSFTRRQSFAVNSLAPLSPIRPSHTPPYYYPFPYCQVLKAVWMDGWVCTHLSYGHV